MRRIGTLALGLYALACLILIVTLSVNRYDWMAEPGSAVGRCDLPLDPDGPLRAFLLQARAAGLPVNLPVDWR